MLAAALSPLGRLLVLLPSVLLGQLDLALALLAGHARQLRTGLGVTGQVLTGLRVEQVDAGGVHPQVHRGARADPGLGGEGGDHDRAELVRVHLLRQVGEHGLDLRVRVELDVAVLLVAEPLEVGQLHLEGRALGLLVLVHECGVLEELGAQAHEHQVAALGGARLLLRDRDIADRGGQHVPAALGLQGRGQEVHRRGADEAGHEQVDRLLVELARGGHLLQHALLEDGHAVAEGHRLGLVVGHVDRGDAQAALHLGDLGAHLTAELGVQVGQRLVEQERVGLADQRTAHGHTLALTAGEVAGLAVQVVVELEHLRGLGHLGLDLVLGELRLLVQAQRERDVLEHRQVRVERVVLEHHGEVAVLGRHLVDAPLADREVAVGDVLEAHDHAQQGGLAAAGGAHEDHELAVGDVQVDALHRVEAVVVGLVDVVQGDGGHRWGSFRSVVPGLSP